MLFALLAALGIGGGIVLGPLLLPVVIHLLGAPTRAAIGRPLGVVPGD